VPISTLTAARDAILTQFKTVWDTQASPIAKVLWQDSDDEVPKGTESWARVTVVHNQGRQATLVGQTGNRRFRRFGLVTVQVFTPIDDGLTKNDILAKLAIDAFEGQTAGGGDRVEFRNVRSNEVGPDGTWFQTNVFAEFEYDEIK